MYHAAVNVIVCFVGMHVKLGWKEFRVVIIFMIVPCILINSRLLAYQQMHTEVVKN